MTIEPSHRKNENIATQSAITLKKQNVNSLEDGKGLRSSKTRFNLKFTGKKNKFLEKEYMDNPMDDNKHYVMNTFTKNKYEDGMASPEPSDFMKSNANQSYKPYINRKS